MSSSDRLQVLCVPAFADNYLWVLHRGRCAVVVDPGDAAPVLAALKAHDLQLEAILVTHHHPDHVGGIAALCTGLGRADLPVWGPLAETGRIPTLTRTLADGDQLDVLGAKAHVIGVPGHTLGHIAYHFADEELLFCGDTLFSAGCGRLFEGTPAQMLDSLSRLASLPDSTAVYCAHEYTQANLAFAAAVEPRNAAITQHRQTVSDLRKQNVPSIPSRIGVEKQINPFLRSGESSVRETAQAQVGKLLPDDLATFAALRAWKDHFRAPEAT